MKPLVRMLCLRFCRINLKRQIISFITLFGKFKTCRLIRASALMQYKPWHCVFAMSIERNNFGKRPRPIGNPQKLVYLIIFSVLYVTYRTAPA